MILRGDSVKEIKSKAYTECPKCGQQATIGTTSSGLIGLGVITLLAGGCLIWIPVLGWVCAPVAFILGFAFIIFGIIAAIIGGATIECKHCNSKYKLTKSEYKDFMRNGEPSFAEQAKESWNESKNSNAHIFINKIEKLENKIENTTDEKKIAKMRKEIKRLEKHI